MSKFCLVLLTACGGDTNAMPACDIQCKKRCHADKNIQCSCTKKDSCECKDGFLYDTKKQKFVVRENVVSCLSENILEVIKTMIVQTFRVVLYQQL